MKESQYVNQIVACIDTFLVDSAVLKVHGNANMPKGTPDLFISFKGQLVVIETKVENNEPSNIQKYRLHYWSESGAVVFWASESFAQPIQVIDFIKYIVNYRLDYGFYEATQFNHWSYWQDCFEMWLSRNR